MEKQKHYGNVKPTSFKHLYEAKLYEVLSDLRFPLMTIILFTTVGVLGLMVINGKTDGKSVADYLFHIIISFTTIGYTEAYQDNITLNRIFMSVFLMVAFPVAYFYGLAATVQVIINGNLKEVHRYWRMYRSMEKVKNHYILCGYNNTTKEIMKMFDERKIEYILVDPNKEFEAELAKSKIKYYVIAEPHFRTVLLGLNIEKAKGLITTFSENTQDISVIVTARLIMPDKEKFHIVATSSNENEADKMTLLGANEVIVPDITTGRRITSYALNPPTKLVSRFYDKLAYGGQRGADIYEINITEGCCTINKTIYETGINKKSGFSVIAYADDNGDIHIGPSEDTVIKQGYTLIVLGDAKLKNFGDKIFEVCS